MRRAHAAARLRLRHARTSDGQRPSFPTLHAMATRGGPCVSFSRPSYLLVTSLPFFLVAYSSFSMTVFSSPTETPTERDEASSREETVDAAAICRAHRSLQN